MTNDQYLDMAGEGQQSFWAEEEQDIEDLTQALDEILYDLNDMLNDINDRMALEFGEF